MSLKSLIQYSGYFVFFLVPAFAIGCSPEKQPQEMAKIFWDALKNHDINVARACATAASRSLIDEKTNQFRNAEVTFGKIIIDGDKTTIDTSVKINKNGAETITPLQTILIRENNIWMVDYQQTKNTMPGEDDPLKDIAKNLQELGEKLSEKMNETLDEVKQKIPDYEEKLKKLGEEATKKIDEAWKKQVSEMKKSIEELGKILNDALKKEGETTPEKKP